MFLELWISSSAMADPSMRYSIVQNLTLQLRPWHVQPGLQIIFHQTTNVIPQSSPAFYCTKNPVFLHEKEIVNTYHRGWNLCLLQEAELYADAGFGVAGTITAQKRNETTPETVTILPPITHVFMRFWESRKYTNTNNLGWRHFGISYSARFAKLFAFLASEPSNSHNPTCLMPHRVSRLWIPGSQGQVWFTWVVPGVMTREWCSPTPIWTKWWFHKVGETGRGNLVEKS